MQVVVKEEIFTLENISNKSLMSRIYKELPKIREKWEKQIGIRRYTNI